MRAPQVQFNRLSNLSTYSSLTFIILLTSLSINTAYNFPAGAKAQFSNSVPTNNFLTYYNSTYGIKIKYPADWEEVGHGMIVKTLNENKSNPSVVAMFVPPSSSGPNLAIVVGDSKNKSLDQNVNESIVLLKKDMPNFNITESNATIIDGIPAHRIVGVGTTTNLGEGLLKKFGLQNFTQILPLGQMLGLNPVIKEMNIDFIKNNRIYGIVYGAPEDQYSQYLSMAQQMIDSFQTSGPTTGANKSLSTASSSSIIPQHHGLLISLAVLKDPIASKDEQTITVTVSDAISKQSISGVEIKGQVFPPVSKSTTTEFDDVTDLNGQVSYSWKISGSSQPGTFIVLVHSNATGYEPKSATTTFDVK